MVAALELGCGSAKKRRYEAMKSVNVKELKNSLSHYLDAAKAGEDIIIREGNETVARLAYR
jgi:hypothetical protein